MDFSEIGVKSRKTGLKAKENVKRDQHNMEDVDDFFQDDQTIRNQQQQQQHHNQQNQPNNINTNGRIIFPPSQNSNSNSNQTNIRNSPLKSPLQTTKSNNHQNSTSDIFNNRSNNNNNNNSDDSDQFDDAIENPQDYSNNDQDDDDMEIDDESRGDIKMIDNESFNNQNFDISFGNDANNDIDEYNKVYPQQQQQQQQQQQPGTPKQSLFVSSESSSPDVNSKSYSQRQQELEKNLTIRSSARKSIGNKSSGNSIIHKSPINSKPNSKSISSISKKIALNKKPSKSSKLKTPPRSTHYSTEEEEEEIDNDRVISDSDEDQIQSNKNTNQYDSDDSEEQIQPPKRRGRPPTKQQQASSPKRSRQQPSINKNDRVNKFQRNNVPNSPNSREHIIDINSLRKEQESRSQSRNKELKEQPTRRSSRVRIPPLAFWRNEKAIYEKSKGDYVPTLKKIITIDEKVDPLPSRSSSKVSSRHTSRQPSRASSKNRVNGRSNPTTPGGGRYKKQTYQPPIFEDDEEQEEDEEEENDISKLPGTEWFRKGYLNIEAFEGHGSDLKNDRLIAWGPGTETYTSEVKSSTDNFKLAILFDKNRDFIATGMMLIPPGGIKSLKGTDTTYFVFYCISGVIEVTLSGNVFIIKKGCSLEIPMGNFYQFVNKGKNDASLFFVQTRGQSDDDWDEDDEEE
ncbi:Midasin [Wickerhamomyces ciferrii]|uniref:Midasin n=1 Tax=Wickerhamomyces ciferrii (strain ATCC 14091 / BCRC 22168 / CBS 111 / JCM 3599 / NBRC 0793 / NRRL Y-1031 F-60-10) TaxID=1206466 RepID=K0KFT4_WICCF|nr:Midasin [Wickerhamomyces ciferrii]CCH44020.1 Midasin [Wickerhamomyces ciferrii]